MSIRRRKKTKCFTQIDNAALRNPKLSLKAKGLLAVMMSCPEEWQFYMDWLQSQSMDGRESHQTAMKELEAHGYVLREKVQGKGGKFSGWEYVVDDEPFTDFLSADSPTNGKAVSRLLTDERENRLTAQPTDGKPAAIKSDFKKRDLKKKRGVLDVTGDAQGSSPSAPVAEPSPAQHSSNDAALQTPTHEAGPVISSPAELPVLQMIRTPVAEPSPAQHSSMDAALQIPTHEAEPITPPVTDLPLPQVPSSPTGMLEQPAPSGVAAEAAGDDLTITDEDAEFLFASGTSTEALETVPGGGAGEAVAEAPHGAALPALALTVAGLFPIPPTDLASRPVAGPESEKALREALGKQFSTYAAEKTRTGNLSRDELWSKLTVEEIRRVMLTARLEASTSKDNMITLVVRGLDRLIGAVKPPKVVVPAADGKVLGPVDLSHLDPHLPEGARCSVGSKLGVVKSVRQNGYIIELDGGDMMTLDRFVAGHLTSLKPSTEPVVAAQTSSDDVVVLAKVGSVYRDLSTGAEVEVKAVQGANRLLNTGHTIPCYQLVNAARFERVGT
ncbi:hypothetical protein [Deinococcus sp. QL22]|uniref:hypothetical protein n=1 Tax=Deinococcus sp. QL22 TaxID=2939437 RepID=UPI00201740A6|nr:hypothetical protein [Deinococcus sp. QL22]UQN10729.1 hypothetical protein M1R55_31335 [Deinococcus sp. QL22]UQN10774.1 hypothetical protein M1R55_31080 [Deinococcus sp. QL22]